MLGVSYQMNKSILLACLLALTPIVEAAKGLSNQTIKTTHVNTKSGFYIKTVEAMINPENCTSSSWYHIDSASLYAKEAFSLVLAAHVAGKTVNFTLNGCKNNYPTITYINISD